MLRKSSSAPSRCSVSKPVPPGSAQDLSDYRERGLGLYLISELADFHYFDQSFKVGTMLVVKKKVG